MTSPTCSTCGGIGWWWSGPGPAHRCDCNPERPARRAAPAPRKGGRRPRRKGVAGELELAEWFRARGIDARRGAQRLGGPDSPDVVAALPFHVEVKHAERLRILAALEQAQRDAGGRPSVVVWRASRAPWVAILLADDLLALLGLGTRAAGGGERAAAVVDDDGRRTTGAA